MPVVTDSPRVDRASAIAAARPVIRLEGIHKLYESEGVSFHALRGVGLSVAAGEFVAIIGASGSGKSTLMNILGCLDRPSRGTYWLMGRDVSQLDAGARAFVRNQMLGFVFQGFNLLARMSAVENVEMPLIYRGIAAKERRRRAVDALQLVGLGARLRNTPAQLSGGQQQRVAIARALVTEPKVLLADEPTGNLDSATSEDLLGLIQRLNRERGLTIVLVTHDAAVASCAKRIVSVRDGLIQADETVPSPRLAG